MRNIAILLPTGHLELTPSVKNLALGLAKGGYQVDLFTLQNKTSPSPKMEHPGVKLKLFPYKAKKFHEPTVMITITFIFWVFKHIAKKHYVCLIAAGIRGLYVATFVSLLRKVPLIYYCLELYPSWEIRNPLAWIAKFLERWSNRRCALTIIQDDQRARLLVKDNGVSLDTIEIIPNSPPGRGELKRTRFLRSKYGIKQHQKVILFAGSVFAPWAPSKELIEAAQSWPDEWVLVLHSGWIPADHSKLEQLQKADVKKRVIFSFEPVPYEKLSDFISSADIGLVLYNPQGDNMRYVGASSGKLMEYLKCGIPVIVSDLPGLTEIVHNHSCGIAISSCKEVQDAVRTILSDYETFVINSIKSFNSTFSLDNYLPHFMKRIEYLTQRETGERETPCS